MRLPWISNVRVAGSSTPAAGDVEPAAPQEEHRWRRVGGARPQVSAAAAATATASLHPARRASLEERSGVKSLEKYNEPVISTDH
jgi:hypothetical protein